MSLGHAAKARGVAKEWSWSGLVWPGLVWPGLALIKLAAPHRT